MYYLLSTQHIYSISYFRYTGKELASNSIRCCHGHKKYLIVGLSLAYNGEDFAVAFWPSTVREF